MEPRHLPEPLDGRAIRQWFSDLGLTPYQWTNGPFDRYTAHQHAYDKYLACERGGIVFHLDDRDITLSAGERLILPAGARHSADVGPDGVACWEAGASARRVL